MKDLVSGKVQMLENKKTVQHTDDVWYNILCECVNKPGTCFQYLQAKDKPDSHRVQ